MKPLPPRRRPRLRRLLLASTTSVATLLIASGIAVANHSPEHSSGVPDHANVETVTVCHVPPTDGVPSEILTIPLAALDGHLGHGDFVLTAGMACPASPPPPPPPPPPIDVCPNIAEAQATVPDGLVLVDGQCVAPPPPPAATDVCPNVAGDQATVPAGLMLVEGECVAETPTTAPTTPVPEADPEVPAATPEASGTPDAPTATAGAADVPTGSTSGAITAPAGALPFTGAPAWLVALAGSVLVLLGGAMHASAARRTPARARG